MYVYAHQILFTSCHNVAMNHYNFSTTTLPYVHLRLFPHLLQAGSHPGGIPGCSPHKGMRHTGAAPCHDQGAEDWPMGRPEGAPMHAMYTSVH